MKWSELRRYAEKRGWVFMRSGKKHDIYCHPDKSYTILIERHDAAEVKKGLMFRMLKQIG
jgi:predicted RNA binding protein YcfA (HicA-like mRNA interferase family)